MLYSLHYLHIYQVIFTSYLSGDIVVFYKREDAWVGEWEGEERCLRTASARREKMGVPNPVTASHPSAAANPAVTHSLGIQKLLPSVTSLK